MSFRLLLLAACALGGCASLPGPDLPTCDGTARRPANLHGSVLSPGTATSVPAVAATHAGSPQTGGCA